MSPAACGSPRASLLLHLTCLSLPSTELTDYCLAFPLVQMITPSSPLSLAKSVLHKQILGMRSLSQEWSGTLCCSLMHPHTHGPLTKMDPGSFLPPLPRPQSQTHTYTQTSLNERLILFALFFPIAVEKALYKTYRLKCTVQWC